jgi:hypothetical protein
MSGTAQGVVGRLKEAVDAGGLTLLGPLLAADVRWGGDDGAVTLADGVG